MRTRHRSPPTRHLQDLPASNPTPARSGPPFTIPRFRHSAFHHPRPTPQVAREAFDPLHPDNKRSLLNNITPSAKETATQGSDHILPLCRPASLAALGIGAAELAQLCAACTAFVRFVVDAVQDSPGLFRPGAV